MPELRTYDELRGVEPLGELWRFHKGERTAVCALRTHALGWELTARVDAKVVSSEVCKTDLRVFQVADVWRATLLDKGWKLPPD